MTTTVASPLRPYQTEAAIRASQVIGSHGGFYVSHPPGAGKSLTAIATARLLKARRIAVVCPLVAVGVWKREIRKWWPQCGAYDPGWINVNHDALPDGVSIAVIVNYDRLAAQKHTLTQLCDWAPDLLIVDEGQYVKSPSANRTRAVWSLADQSAGVLYLSGTPAHSPVDWWAQYRVVARGDPAFRMNFTAFKQSLLVLGGPNDNWPMKDKRTGQMLIRPDAFKQVTQAMAPYTHLAPHALDDLEEPVEQEIPFALDAEETRVYQAMADYLRAELGDGSETTAEIVITKLMRLIQISAGHVTNGQGQTASVGHSREEALFDLLEQHADEKVVVACRFTEDIKRTYTRLAGSRAATYIDGSITGPERTKREEWFQTTDEPAVILLQYQAGGVAITLTAAKVLVLYTLDPSVIRYQQMIGRIFRIGQKGRCLIYTMCADNTQDALMLSALKHGVSSVDLARILLSQLRTNA
jgi:superfamily II DNA or RNA helicase